ncbi:GUN4 domain-containing protein [Laspinema olomoucense]|uniref:GUN4 domain-containing protein n=1 Tax=Laspinema olomoucense D3b TaxID=2953688 RepID=A0ABT2N2N9_9CYAN|nr:MULTISPECIES: GUN4 domain-containing protein [unclassified Laspinema]MCT7970540.1 GUN4 domain-containing protein [Laspinema sp. D3d]MCT7976959.1 GUN4 domain-containing protein [Laspinema sp. D3b]MCT7989595.1 GUN4 domain-containing protein [Laspinema sp. D3a]
MINHCPVCDTEYLEGEYERCSSCGWDLTPVPGSASSKLRKAFLAKQQIQIDWARRMWVRQQMPGEFTPHPAGKFNDSERFSQLENQVDERFNQVTIQLQEARGERAYLQSQIEWISAYLQGLNFQQIETVLSQVSEWIQGSAILPTQGETAEPFYPSSEVGIDYSRLMNLLSKGKWRKADEETWAITLKATVREEEGWLSIEDLERFPKTDLVTLNWLWEYYSHGQFGLRVQQEIWERVQGDYTAFCDRVRWRVQDNWIYYDELDFSLEAVAGHLPAIAWRKRSCYGVGKSTAQEALITLFHSLQNI